MNQFTNFNRVKILLLQLAKSHGLSDENLAYFDENKNQFDWSINWKEDLDKSFSNDVNHMHENLNIYEEAISKGDLIAARTSLLYASIFAHNLTSLIESIKDDLNQASIDERFKWPEIPENYQIPKCYKKDN